MCDVMYGSVSHVKSLGQYFFKVVVSRVNDSGVKLYLVTCMGFGHVCVCVVNGIWFI